MLTNRFYSQVWFAHKPVCGPPTADFRFPPELTPFESRILRSPTFRRTFSERRPRGTSAATFVQVIGELERECHLIPGSFMQVRGHQRSAREQPEIDSF
jgi:hypothetical protein